MNLSQRLAKLESGAPVDDGEVRILCFVSPNTPKPEPIAYSTGFGHLDWRCERALGESADAHQERAKATMPSNPHGGRVLLESYAVPVCARDADTSTT
jgi:hypothetical protein